MKNKVMTAESPALRRLAVCAVAVAVSFAAVGESAQGRGGAPGSGGVASSKAGRGAIRGTAAGQMKEPKDAARPLNGGCRHPGDVKTLTLPGGATMEVIYCEPGEFWMGSPVGEDGRDPDETRHRVTLTKGFWLGKYEVTQRQWQSVMGNNPSHFKSSERPVENVSWDDCQEFVRAVNARVKEQLGGTARLPTEAEWEYACRAGTDTSLPSGQNLVVLGKNNGRGLNPIAWYGGNSCIAFELANGYDCLKWEEKEFDGLSAGTHPVGRKDTNKWGFHDMIGNVWEWCEDTYDKDFYSTGSAIDPCNRASGEFRVLRGGSWGSDARDCRSASRDGSRPGNRFILYGFRLCCSAGPRE